MLSRIFKGLDTISWQLTQVRLRIALDWLVVGCVEVVVDNVGMGDFDIGLKACVSNECAVIQSRSTHPDVVVEVVPHREVDPLVGRDHRSPVSGLLDDIKLVFRSNAA